MRKGHAKKIIMPVIIAVLVGLYFIGITVYLVEYSIVNKSLWAVLLAIIPVILLCILIYVTIERISEIKGGQEDDLSKY